MTEKLTRVERLILRNQYAILEALESEYSNKEFLLALDNGYTKEIEEFLDSSVSEELPISVCTEVWSILDMFRALNNSYDRLEDKTDISVKEIQFEGFDANNDSHYGYMNYVLSDRGRYDESMPMNSHCQATLPMYRRMLSVWESFDKPVNLNSEQIKSIIGVKFVAV
ncbi:MAG: YfbU family protein [Vampirovibrionales bacterium]|nr:YfbU family protein [Vampirovibrionales bacterium]